MLERLKHKNGFTLVELMVGLVIASISTVALYYMFEQGQVLFIEQEHRRQALIEARKLLTDKEKKVAVSKALDEGIFTQPVILQAPNPDDEDDPSGLTGIATFDIEKLPFGYLVKLTISWQERSGRKYKIFMPRTIKLY